MQTDRRQILMLLCTVCIVTISQVGCFALLLAGGAGTGTIAYATGELKAVEARPIWSVRDACAATIAAMGYDLKENEGDKFRAEIVAATMRGDDVVIRLVSLPRSRTEVKIRVGAFGDETLSRLILEKIQQNLEITPDETPNET